MEALWFYLPVGAFAGLTAGLLGVGGGIVVVPALAILFTQQGMAPALVMHRAIATSLAAIMVTALSSVLAHHRYGAVRWTVFSRLAPGIATGAVAGAAVADALPSQVLRLLFGVFEVLVALQLMLAVRPSGAREPPGTLAQGLAGLVIGTISASLGIGGGTLTVPLLLWWRVPIRNAVATAAACGLPIAVAGSLGFVVAGWHSAAPGEWSLGYVYLPALAGVAVASVLLAPLGARLAHRLPRAVLQRVFALFLAVLGVRMLAG